MRYISNKIIFHLLLSYFFSISLVAQTEWYKKGETFYYDVITAWDFENYGLHSITYVKDTVINDHILKMLTYTDKRGDSMNIFIQQAGEKVRHYTPFPNKFTLMYDFTALPGDPSPVTGYTIEKTGFIEIENTTRKTQTWKKGNKSVLVVEGIGMVGDVNFTALYVCSPPVPTYGCTGFVDGWDYYFRCLKSDEIHFDPYGKCSTSGSIDDIVYLALYPNPTNKTFTVKSNRLFDEYRIIDQTGKKVDHKTISPSIEVECQVDIKPGLYFMQMFNLGTFITTKKLAVLPGE